MSAEHEHLAGALLALRTDAQGRDVYGSRRGRPTRGELGRAEEPLDKCAVRRKPGAASVLTCGCGAASASRIRPPASRWRLGKRRCSKRRS